MAIKTVRANINGTWHTMTYNSGNGAWEATVNAPGATSYNQPNGYYNVQVEATNDAGTKGTGDGSTVNGLRLVVKETVAPVITIVSPASGARVTNNKQPVVFNVTDEAGGSGVDLESVVVKLDGNSVASNEITHSSITNGYSFTYTPASVLPDEPHTVSVNGADNDGSHASGKRTSFTGDTPEPISHVTSPTDGRITNYAAVPVASTTTAPTSSHV